MSTTTNLKLFKHDNPTTNTNQFDVEKALNQNWDKLDANAGEMSSKIQALEIATNEKDTSQDEEIQVLKAENALLKSQIPSATVVGETVHLEDSSNMQCQITPLGASKQETREGYNLLQITREDVTAYGVTVTVNKDKSITFNGTATSYATFILSNIGFTMEAGDYVLSNRATGTVNGISFIRFDDANGNTIGNNTSHNSQVTKFTLTENKEVAKCRADFSEGSVLTNYTIYPMLIKGTEEKPYEQYGASPSIEYEAPIESVGDNINLFDKDNANIEKALLSDGGTLADSSTTKTIIHKTKPNTAYTISKIQSTYFRIAEFEDIPTIGKAYLNRIKNDSATKITYNTSNIGNYIAITYYTATDSLTEQEILDSIKIVEGTSTGAYSPYGQGSITVVNSNKNLFDLETYFNTCGNSSCTKKLLENGIQIDFTADADAYLGAAVSKGNSLAEALRKGAIKVKPNTKYTIQVNATPKCYISFLDSNFVGCEINHYFTKTYDAVKYTFTTGATTEYIYLRFGIRGDNYTTFAFTDIQVEEGETATDYIEHQGSTNAIPTQQPFRAIGDVKDRFVKQNGVWYEEHDIKRVLFNGTENWSKSSNINIDRYIIKIEDKIMTEHSGVLTNYFKQVNSWSLYEIGTCISGAYGTAEAVYFDWAEYGTSTLDEFKTWLSENNLIVDYVLAEPELIPCTPEQVEELESFKTYKNVTNISSDSIGELEVTYSKDIETLLNNISQAVLGGN